MTLALVALLVLTDVAPSPPIISRPKPTAQCTRDDQCVLSTFQGCCGSCCASDPRAVPAGTNEGARCAAIDCALPSCEAVRCAAPRPVSDFEAVCRAGQCVAVPRAANQCRVDAECVVTTAPAPGAACLQSACGCCPVSRAAPADERPPVARSPNRPKGKPAFGLSASDGNPSVAPQCSPCPAPAPASAACKAGRCVLVTPRPLPPG